MSSSLGKERREGRKGENEGVLGDRKLRGARGGGGLGRGGRVGDHKRIGAVCVQRWEKSLERSSPENRCVEEARSKGGQDPSG